MKISYAIKHLKGKEVKIDVLCAIGALVDLAYEGLKHCESMHIEPYNKAYDGDTIKDLKEALEDTFPYLVCKLEATEKEISKYRHSTMWIEAIRDFRTRTGCGLKEARDILDKATGNPYNHH